MSGGKTNRTSPLFRFDNGRTQTEYFTLLIPLSAVSCKTKKPRATQRVLVVSQNTPGRIRTSNLRLRRPTLYPIELRGRGRASA